MNKSYARQIGKRLAAKNKQMEENYGDEIPVGAVVGEDDKYPETVNAEEGVPEDAPEKEGVAAFGRYEGEDGKAMWGPGRGNLDSLAKRAMERDGPSAEDIDFKRGVAQAEQGDTWSGAGGYTYKDTGGGEIEVTDSKGRTTYAKKGTDAYAAILGERSGGSEPGAKAEEPSPPPGESVADAPEGESALDERDMPEPPPGESVRAEDISFKPGVAAEEAARPTGMRERLRGVAQRAIAQEEDRRQSKLGDMDPEDQAGITMGPQSMQGLNPPPPESPMGVEDVLPPETPVNAPETVVRNPAVSVEPPTPEAPPIPDTAESTMAEPGTPEALEKALSLEKVVEQLQAIGADPETVAKVASEVAFLRGESRV